MTHVNSIERSRETTINYIEGETLSESKTDANWEASKKEGPRPSHTLFRSDHYVKKLELESRGILSKTLMGEFVLHKNSGGFRTKRYMIIYSSLYSKEKPVAQRHQKVPFSLALFLDASTHLC